MLENGKYNAGLHFRYDNIMESQREASEYQLG